MTFHSFDSCLNSKLIRFASLIVIIVHALVKYSSRTWIIYTKVGYLSNNSIRTCKRVRTDFDRHAHAVYCRITHVTKHKILAALQNIRKRVISCAACIDLELRDHDEREDDKGPDHGPDDVTVCANTKAKSHKWVCVCNFFISVALLFLFMNSQFHDFATNHDSWFMISMMSMMSWHIVQQRLVYSISSIINNLLLFFSSPKWEISSEARRKWTQERERLVNWLHPKWMQLLHLLVSEVNLFFSKNIIHLPIS